MSDSVVLPTIQPTEIVQLPPNGFDFTSRLAAGETLTGVPTVTVTVYSGTDPNPSAVKSGAASISGNTVVQKFTGGLAGVIYSVVAACSTSLGQSLQQWAYLVVV
jgi:hypothetical protein